MGPAPQVDIGCPQPVIGSYGYANNILGEFFMRIAMIGLGDIARKAYLPVVANHPEITPLLCTRNTQTLAALAQQYRVADCFNTLESLLAAKPDAAMIHSNTESHAHIATQLLNAGIPTFIDKPLSYQLHECEALLNLATQKNIPLTVGFNRRFAPLIAPLADVANPLHIHWQKNRVNLPNKPRIFIYDDFIHVLDSLRFLAPGILQNLHITTHGKTNALGAIQVQWQRDKTLLTASMNRVSGVTEERVEFFAAQQKWQIDSLTTGVHYEDNQARSLGFGDWENTLYKRGFVTMINAWVAQVHSGHLSAHDDILATHALCERVVNKTEMMLSNN